MPNPFLDAARLGRNDWWRYALTLAVVLFATFILGSVPLVAGLAYVMLDSNPATSYDPATGALLGLNPTLSFVLLLLPFVAWLVALILSVAVFHRRHPRTLVTPRPQVRWSRAAAGAAVWVALVTVMTLLEALIFPGRYVFTPNLPVLLPFAIAAVFLIPLQTSAEELFFRGYFLQAAGLVVRRPLVLAALSGLLFALPHAANPEVAVSFWPAMGFYFVFGAVLAALTLREGGAELALGVHAANNLFTVLFANFDGSALKTPALFTASGFDPWYNLVGTAVALLVLCLIFGLLLRPRRIVEASSFSLG
jgi:membrane protease YdiL (CAAX protease family)